MAGLSAAARVAQAGGTVAIVEKGESTGGSAAVAEFLWTAPNLGVLREEIPDGDLALHERLIERRWEALEWVRDRGVTVGPPVELLGYGTGNRVDMSALTRGFEQSVREAGGCEVLTQADPISLLTEDGRVTGAEIALADGTHRAISARSTLLATGGFGGNHEMRRKYLHPNALEIPLRANPHSAGRGIELGLAVGAAFGADDAGFYGHLMAAGVPMPPMAKIAMYSFFHSEHGVLVNREGKRYVDETRGDQLSTLATIRQTGGRALLICDERVHQEWMLKAYVPGLEAPDKFNLAYRAGARCATAADLDEFASLPSEWGYPGATVRDTLIEFNAQCASGNPSPSRRRDPNGLNDPPYYVIEVTPALTFTFGGLLIDRDARVLGGDGEPIPGRLAAGADAGGLQVRGYAGGLAPAMVFGMCAADTALAEARALRS